jgi:hypothetical protein
VASPHPHLSQIHVSALSSRPRTTACSQARLCNSSFSFFIVQSQLPAPGRAGFAAGARGLQRSLRLDGNDTGALVSRGFTYLKLGQLADAIVDYDAARRVPRCLPPRFELFNECSEMRGNGSREGVVLVLQVLPNC